MTWKRYHHDPLSSSVMPINRFSASALGSETMHLETPRRAGLESQGRTHVAIRHRLRHGLRNPCVATSFQTAYPMNKRGCLTALKRILGNIALH
jgi:hypothetical protein